MKVIYNGKLRNMTKQEIADYKKSIEVPLDMQIQALEQNLRETDPLALRFVEGIISAEEYAPIKKQREEWLAEIKRLEEEAKTDGN